MKDAAGEPLAKEAFAKEYLDLIRAALNTLTWTAVSVGVAMISWSTGSKHGGAAQAIAVVVTLIAALTSLGANYSLWVVMQAFRKKVSRKTTPWVIMFAVAFLGPVGVYFFGFTALLVLIVPIVKNLIVTQ